MIIDRVQTLLPLKNKIIGNTGTADLSVIRCWHIVTSMYGFKFGICKRYVRKPSIAEFRHFGEINYDIIHDQCNWCKTDCNTLLRTMPFFLFVWRFQLWVFSDKNQTSKSRSDKDRPKYGTEKKTRDKKKCVKTAKSCKHKREIISIWVMEITQTRIFGYGIVDKF